MIPRSTRVLGWTLEGVCAIVYDYAALFDEDLPPQGWCITLMRRTRFLLYDCTTILSCKFLYFSLHARSLYVLLAPTVIYMPLCSIHVIGIVEEDSRYVTDII
jgi:hypothetical protein